MKVLIVIDKEGTAIWRLADSVKRSLPQHEIKIYPVHPKRNDIDTLIEVQRLMAWCDILDIHYWKSGQILRTSFPNEFNAKPKILFHFNPYDAENDENQYYDKVVVGNEEIYTRISFAHLIPYGINLNFFKFNDNYTKEKVVNMSVARIEGKKGVLEVARACKELGYKFKLVGRVSKDDYMREVMKAGQGVIEFWENASEEKLREIYYSSMIHVCNSVDGFESGTLPILECMACGVPVLTRSIGHVPDLYDGSNMVIREGKQDDYEDLKKNMSNLVENEAWREKIREKAWETAKHRDERKMANKINSLYWNIFNPDVPLMSVIIPTKDNPEAFLNCFVGALQQDYPKYEIVIADSGNTPVKQIVDEAKKNSSVSIKYLYFPNKGNYTLAEARNRAVVESDGEYLVFCDDRIRMEPDAVKTFSVQRRVKTWFWGIKDDAAKGFVENFCCVNRRDLIAGGMFCERMQWYGGMTQEIRERFERCRGFEFIFLSDAKAYSNKKAKSKKSRKESIIEAKYLISKMYDKGI